MAFSCKKYETAPADNLTNKDTISTSIDSVGPNSDTATVNNPGTTGATGEGSTGSGSAGTVQKGSSLKNSNTDSIQKSKQK